MLKLIEGFNKKKLVAVLRYIVSDFKTVEKKFLDQGIAEERVKKYLGNFKLLKDQQKIKDDNEKNIDFWGKKPFEDLVDFVDSLKDVPTFVRQLKQKQIKGADLIFENDDWYVYRITKYEASKFLADNTGWCIKHEDHWKRYYKDADFYFYISKNRTDNWRKIALQKKPTSKTYWDAEDKSHDSVPTELKLPNLNIEFSGRIKVNNDWCSPYELEELPEYTTVDNLKLKELPNLKKLPEHFTVKDTLDLRGSELETLPEYLTVRKIILSDSKIKQLPKNASFERIILTDSNVETLPDNLNVETIYLQSSKIKKLPKNLKVSILDLVNTDIKELPPDLKVQTLDLQGSKVKKLPPNFECYTINGIDNLEDLNNLPEGLTTGMINLTDNKNITKLPLTLKTDYLSVSGTGIKQLPKNTKYNILDISNTLIKDLPDNLVVKEILDMRKTLITKLPANLKVGIFYLNQKVTELPNDMDITERLIVKENQLTKIPEHLISKIREIY